MKLITDIDDLTGKTIAKVVEVECGDNLGFIFEDDSYAVVDNCFYGESHDMQLADHVDEHTKMEMGVITVEEFNAMRAEIQLRHDANNEAREREEYEKLRPNIIPTKEQEEEKSEKLWWSMQEGCPWRRGPWCGVTKNPSMQKCDRKNCAPFYFALSIRNLPVGPSLQGLFIDERRPDND